MIRRQERKAVASRRGIGMRIAVDIDSTLHHYWDILARVARRRYGVELSYDAQTRWEIETLTREQLRACIRETHSPREILAARPYPGAQEALDDWHRRGHAVFVTSHREEAARAATAAWLERHGFPCDGLRLSPDKTVHFLELGVELVIDDSPPVLLGAREHGMLTATIIHPWNRHLVHRDGVVGAHTWPELKALLDPVVGRGAGRS